MIDFGVLFSNSLSQLIGLSAIFFALMALGLNIHFGYTGLLNFGQIGFALVGGYGMGIVVANYGFPLWVGVLVGMLCGVLLALLLGIPTLRLRADYLAIVTIAAAEILRLVTRSVSMTEVTGGTQGLTGFGGTYSEANPFTQPEYSILGLTFRGPELWTLVVGWIVVALCVLLTWLLVRSPWGRVLKAIREDEDAARALGKNVFAYKMQALMLGGVFGALGGMIQALGTQALTPDFYSPTQTFYAYAALILGGAGTVLGPVIRSRHHRRVPAPGDGRTRPADPLHRIAGRRRDPVHHRRCHPGTVDGVPPAGHLGTPRGGAAQCALRRTRSPSRRPTSPTNGR
jgi:ABC-type branched-subunit amino acid transport system permease subunit